MRLLYEAKKFTSRLLLKQFYRKSFRILDFTLGLTIKIRCGNLQSKTKITFLKYFLDMKSWFL